MFKKLPVTTLVGAVLLVSVGACTAKAVDAPPAPGAVGASSGNPPPTVGSSPSVPPFLEIPTTPFKRATADQVVDAWTARWHPRFRVLQNRTLHVRQAVIDNPYGPGTLELDVSQRGTGKDPGAVGVGLIVRDPSVKGSLKVAPGTLPTLLQACFSPTLSGAQIKQTSSWVASENLSRKTADSHDFAGVRVNFLNSYGQFAVTVLPH
jgi:hypothetical protein